MKLALVLLLILYSTKTLAVDFIKCKRENPRTQTRQFCYIESSPQEVTKTIKLSPDHQDDPNELINLLASKKIVLFNSESKPESYYLD
ncbi:MAG: hypothetical protein HQK51_20830, partial [Oligoflexia bacterium]|nr:hypothetical protein [Oligoflexia bacterium]